MTAFEVRDRLLVACRAAGSQRAWALAHGISPVYVGEVLKGVRDPGPLVLRVLGLRRRVVYEVISATRLTCGS